MKNEIILNGKPHTLIKKTSLFDLIGGLGLQDKGIATVLNSKIISKDERAQSLLKDGDVVEVIHAVGGG